MTAVAQGTTSTDLAQSWGWSLLWLFLIIFAGAMLLVMVRRLTFGGGIGTPLVRHAKKRKPTETSSVWEAAGRRMQAPAPPSDGPDLKEEP